MKAPDKADCRKATSAIRMGPTAEETPRKGYDRVRSARPSHGERAALVRGFHARRALRAAEPNADLGDLRGVPDRERRHPSGALRRRILPRPRHATSARTWIPDLDPYRTGRRIVSVHGRGIAGRLP